MKRVSLNDIAKSLGVSKTLVSMVLNNLGDQNGISQKTQEKVWEKARELNYQPNYLARSLRTGRSKTLGLIVADISNIFYSRLARVIEDAAAKQNYNLIICSTDEKAEKEIELIEMLRARQVDGIILSTTQKNSKRLQNLLKAKFPFVQIDRFFDELKADTVAVDNYKGSAQLTKHLVDIGCQNIGILAISPLYTSVIQQRIAGCIETCKENGLEWDERHIKTIEFADIDGNIEKAIDEWFSNGNAPDAVFSLNNRIAISFMQACKKRNIQIPEQVKLASFDDIEYFELLWPPMTAVAQPFRQMGQKSVEMLIDSIENKKHEYQKIILDTELKIRKSTQLK